MEDDRISILEAQLAQAKLIAEEADKKYEEVKLTQHKNAEQKNNKKPQNHLIILMIKLIEMLLIFYFYYIENHNIHCYCLVSLYDLSL